MPKVRYLRDYRSLVFEWDFVKNYPIGINDRVKSAVKYWWLCRNGHSYAARINNRVCGKAGCPICAGNVVCDNNRFSIVASSDLKIEWSQKNEYRMEDVAVGSDVLIWWRCRKCGNEWRTNIRSRTKLHSGCPKCNKGRQGSRLEIRIFSELSYLIPNIGYRSDVDGREADIFLETYRIVIEVDGFRWHKNREIKDLEKNCFFEDRGIKVIRVREEPLPRIGDNDLLVSKKSFMEDGHFCVMNDLAKLLSNMGVIEMSSYNGFVNPGGYLLCSKGHCFPDAKVSLAVASPDVARLWHPVKNEPLAPEYVSFSSAKKVWWKCMLGHEWEASVNTMSRIHGTDNTGCPYCNGKKVSLENCLAVKYPEVFRIWSPRNTLMPNDFTISSGKRVWCKCSICGADRFKRVVDVVKTWLLSNNCCCRSCKIKNRLQTDALK